VTHQTSRLWRLSAIVVGVLAVGVAAARLTPTTLLVSVNRAGTGSGNGDSFFPVLSADDRVVAFESFASDLVAHDTNGTADVFARLLAGDESETEGGRDALSSPDPCAGVPLFPPGS